MMMSGYLRSMTSASLATASRHQTMQRSTSLLFNKPSILPISVSTSTTFSIHSASTSHHQQQQQLTQLKHASRIISSSRSSTSTSRSSSLLQLSTHKISTQTRSFHATSQTSRGGDNNSPPPQSFVSAFVDSFRRQVKENQQMQENMKMLSAETSKISESDAVKRAKELADASAQGTNKVVTKVAEVAEKIAENEAVQKTAEVLEKGVETVENIAEKAADPIMKTKIAQTIKHDILETSHDHHFIEYKPKEMREKEFAERMAREALANPMAAARNRPVLANPEAQGVVLHKSSKWTKSWESFKEENPMMQKLFTVSKNIEESENPVVETLRDWKDRVADFFAETEHAKVMKAFQYAEPGFRTDKWMKWVTEYGIPEVMEAMLKSDQLALKDWCSEATYSVLSAGIKAQKTQGLISDCKLLDIRDVEMHSAKLLNDEIPVFVVTFRTQEVLLFRNAKGEVAVGKEDAIETAQYIAVWTKDQALDPSEPINARTNGWRVVEMAKQGTW